MSLITILFSCLLFWQVQGHVRLTFPPARTYALDFLDNARTRGPCGYPPYEGRNFIVVTYVLFHQVAA